MTAEAVYGGRTVSGDIYDCAVHLQKRLCDLLIKLIVFDKENPGPHQYRFLSLQIGYGWFRSLLSVEF